MATKPTVQQNTGVFATAFCCVALVLGYTYYLTQTNQQLDLQSIALAEHWYQIKPDWVRQLISAGGFVGTLSAVVLLICHGMLYCGMAFGAAYLGIKHLTQKSEPQGPDNSPQAKAAKGVNSAEIPGSELMVMLPKYPGAERGGWQGGAIDKNPYQQDFYRIERATVHVKEGVEMTAIKRLYLAIYEMLKAHPDVPASIGGHHADAPLFEHSLSVATKVQEYYKERRRVEPLAAVAGLAHDLDKLLAYKRSGDKWVKNVSATHHNKYAAYIVSTQPEWRELPEDDRNTLVLALRYYHDPDNLPIGASNRTEALILALRMCDGYAIKEEKAAGVQTLNDDQLEAIEKALLDTISELNINGYLSKNGHAGGWTTPALEYFLTPMSTVLELLGKHLPAELNRKLQLDHETRTFKHPAAKLISDRLNKLGLLMTTYKTLSSDIGLYDCRIGSARFTSVLLLNKDELEKLLPGLNEKWGTAAYRIRIVKPTEDNSVQGDSDIEEPEE
ncbi:HD domain-containing protein [Pseudomonas putida]|uniref:HD domain-containing protein n=1 Tax=Pseudomonas putida TaxID=303 RepID=UPI0023643A4F|nr:HD domain-containing protein [Pseudomonas putida]MDD2139607.1 HD domain-containing protein [Pseudomonas putida]HDS1721530.1 HD domain-containing protein [Pseudomonas putida]